MEVRITPELAAELAHIATRTGRTPEQLAAAALALGMKAERRFLKAVEQGIASADSGRFVEDEQVVNNGKPPSSPDARPLDRERRSRPVRSADSGTSASHIARQKPPYRSCFRDPRFTE